MAERRAIIIGAGPAGLTAAFELLQKTNIRPVLYESSREIGGISRTVNHHGNRIDIGGHRFFSKSDRVMQWWETILPPQGAPSRDDLRLDREIPLSERPGAPDPEQDDRVMLVRNRRSRIFFRNRFFPYPLSFSPSTLVNLGLRSSLQAALSLLRARLRPIRPEESLEDFFINRFGLELYATFFKDYTEKVWGVSCREIQPEWGRQRVKGLSVTKAIVHTFTRGLRRDGSVRQQDSETSLIERFYYPKFGPGQLWENVARIVREKGGEIHLGHEVIGLEARGERIEEAVLRDVATGEVKRTRGEFFFSSMPCTALIQSLDGAVPEAVRDVAAGLRYRDFLTVGLLLPRLRQGKAGGNGDPCGALRDNWIYIQEPGMTLGRLQIFNNWSPYMLRDDRTAWLGLEYFCQEGDELWRRADEDLTRLAMEEISALGFSDEDRPLDSVVIRVPKAYPAYFGTYDRFEHVRRYTDHFANLFLVGRNGMHRYNNMDHSMLTAMASVDNVVRGVRSKENIWAVNEEEAYHEENDPSSACRQGAAAQSGRIDRYRTAAIS